MEEELNIPDLKWVGKTLEITKNDSFPIISGSDFYSIELKRGQKVKVVGRQKGNWLQVIILNALRFQGDSQLSGKIIDISKIYSSKRIIAGISLNYDRDKFKIV